MTDFILIDAATNAEVERRLNLTPDPPDPENPEKRDHGIYAGLELTSKVGTDEAPITRTLRWLELIDAPPTFDAEIETRAAGAPVVTSTTYTATYDVSPRDLVVVKAIMVSRGVAAVGAVTSRYLTVRPGKDLEYWKKVEECRAFDAAAPEDRIDANFKMLRATYRGRNLAPEGTVEERLQAARDLIWTTYTGNGSPGWEDIGAALCEVEDTFKTAVDAAADADDVHDAYAALTAALGGF